MVRLHSALLALGALCASCSSGPGDVATHTLYGRFDAAQGLPELSAHRDRGGGADLYLIQFHGPIDSARRGAVLQSGARLVRYYPDHAFVVRASTAQLATLAQRDDVRTIQLFPDQLRLSPKLLINGQLDMGAGAQVVNVEVASNDAAVQVMQDIRGLGGQVLRAPTLGRVVRAALTPAQIQELLANLDVQDVEPFTQARLHNNVEYGPLQAGEPNTSPMWTAGLDGYKQIVAISDGALVYPSDSCRFENQRYTKVLNYVKETGATFTDPNYFAHATHVAGIVAGDNLNDGIYESEDGMAPAAQIYFQALGDGLEGMPSDLTDLFSPAFDAGAFIHTNSWGTGSSYSDARAVDSFVYENPSYLLIFAVGNEGEPNTISDPALAKNCLGIGSTDDMNNVSAFSSQGPTPDGRIKPDLVGSGNNVMSASWSADPTSSPPGQSTCNTIAMSGTSMAAPNIAGAAVIAREYYNEGFYPTGNANAANAYTYPSAALLRATLVASAQDMANGNNTGGHFPAMGQGFGRPQLDEALYLSGSSTQRLFAVDTVDGLSTGQSKVFTFHVQFATPLKFVLVWSDPEPAATASKLLVNNLDLTVSTPGGVQYKGNALTDGVSVSSNQGDANNTTEIFYVPTAQVGAYTVTVTGVNVPGDASLNEIGAQNFALVGVGAFAPTDLSPLVNSASQDPNNGASSASSGTVGGGGGGGGGGGYDPEQGASASGGGIVDKSGCTAVAPNNALLLLLIGLWYLLPKPPRRKRARVRAKK